MTHLNQSGPPRRRRKRDRTALAFVVATGLAVAVTAGTSLGSVATGAFHGIQRAIGIGRTDAIEAEQHRQATAVGHVQHAVGRLQGAVDKLEISLQNVNREVVRLNSRSETVDRHAAAAADRFVRLDADVAAIRSELVALHLEASESAGDAPWRSHIDDLNTNLARQGIEIGVLRSSLAARDDVQRTQVAAVTKRIDRLETTTAAREATGSIRPKPMRQRVRRTLPNWSVGAASVGAAVITGERGTYEVGPGTIVPGLGRVADVRQRGQRWIVVTDKGIITQR